MCVELVCKDIRHLLISARHSTASQVEFSAAAKPVQGVALEMGRFRRI